ncbi:MAG: hypothetical protein ACR2OL_10325 [Anderseniella sp.]|jgi:hypothetical protein
MNITIYWLVFTIVFLSLVALPGPGNAAPKTVNVCVSLKLPAPGKCTYMNVRGYKVRVCR